jgi:hypothetical protein
MKEKTGYHDANEAKMQHSQISKELKQRLSLLLKWSQRPRDEELTSVDTDRTGTGAGAANSVSPGSSASISIAPPWGGPCPYGMVGTTCCCTGLVYDGAGDCIGIG